MDDYVVGKNALLNIAGVRAVLKSDASLTGRYSIELYYSDGKSYTVSFSILEERDETFDQIVSKLTQGASRC